MTVQYKRIFASILFVLISFVCLAQTGNPPPPQPPPPPGLAIDMGVIFGVVLGLFFGIKKLLKIHN
jgi:hypothetical protein